MRISEATQLMSYVSYVRVECAHDSAALRSSRGPRDQRLLWIPDENGAGVSADPPSQVG